MCLYFVIISLVGGRPTRNETSGACFDNRVLFSWVHRLIEVFLARTDDLSFKPLYAPLGLRDSIVTLDRQTTSKPRFRRALTRLAACTSFPNNCVESDRFRDLIAITGQRYADTIPLSITLRGGLLRLPLQSFVIVYLNLYEPRNAMQRVIKNISSILFLACPLDGCFIMRSTIFTR